MDPLRIRPRSGRSQWLLTGAMMGLVTGVVFGLFQMIVSGLAGAGFLAPLVAAASIVDGPAALDAHGLTFAALSADEAELVWRGVAVHAALSALHGALFALVASVLVRTTRLGVFLLGPVFGAALWLAHFRVAVPLLFPWYPELGAATALAGHLALFGTVLGLLVSRRMDPYTLGAELIVPTRAPAR